MLNKYDFADLEDIIMNKNKDTKQEKPKQDKKPRKKRQTGKGNVTAIDDWRKVIENM